MKEERAGCGVGFNSGYPESVFPFLLSCDGGYVVLVTSFLLPLPFPSEVRVDSGTELRSVTIVGI
jgi:hypothetical protein